MVLKQKYSKISSFQLNISSSKSHLLMSGYNPQVFPISLIKLLKLLVTKHCRLVLLLAWKNHVSHQGIRLLCGTENYRMSAVIWIKGPDVTK
jgi:hypothetical protein